MPTRRDHPEAGGARRSSGRSHPVVEAIRGCSPYARLRTGLPRPGESARVEGLVGSLPAVLLAALHGDAPERIVVVVTADPSAAAGMEADLETLLGTGVAHLYPQRETLPYEETEGHVEIAGLRVEAVEALLGNRTRLLVTTGRALQERAPIPTRLADLRLDLRLEDRIELDALTGWLEAGGFERVPMVEEVGQFAVRGGIVDIFSFGSGDPVRIELWGNEVSSLRHFDILDQRSVRETEEVHFLPVALRGGNDEEAVVGRSLLELLPREALLCLTGTGPFGREAARTWDQVVRLHDERRAEGSEPAAPESIFLPPDDLVARIEAYPRLHLFADGAGSPEDDGALIEPGGWKAGDAAPTSRTALRIDALPPPAIDRDIDRLGAALRESAARRERSLILCDNEGQVERLEELLGLSGERGGTGDGSRRAGDSEPRRPGPLATIAVGSLQGGFRLECAAPPTVVYTDHEIFRRSRRLRRGRRFSAGGSLESLAQLSPGDHVVHMDHGIGVFRGLQKVEVGGETIEALAIEYADAEILRVPIYRLDLLERWVGESDEAPPPTVHRIGGKRWKTLKRKTEQAIERMTAELLELYARRRTAEGYAFSPDTKWQKEMESSFLYEDTPDQRRATEDVKRDMESPRPMDRLVCGDVGYGKTEVAIRAAFKAVQDGKQVVVLAPTTILVEQHRHTFQERLADYPVRIAALSRFRTAKEQRAILQGLETGAIDIVIGTHRLLSPDVHLHDLGLLVVDEEQRFGVKHKERLKQLRASVDVLTLTATPIPRTLYISLAGIRDLSLIRTPPRDRMPIITHVLSWSDPVIADALHREMDRGGQTFFLHNRVQTIQTAAERVHRLVPESRMGVAHGQMSPAELDEVMREFVDGEIDLLVCTSIIENGLDVPDANTLVVDRADTFGLAQLYQIRGRVGRSDRRAYCYLVVPERPTEEARRRLKVLEHHTELGSGYAVALRDLELRGAGNLLGADQSGFAHQVGLDTYLRLVEETVRRMKEGEGEEEGLDPEVSMQGGAYLPDAYVPDAGQKLHLYRRLSKLRHLAEVDAFRDELADRYGPVPPEVERLVGQTELRILARALRVERIFVREREARVQFRTGVVPRLTALESAESAPPLEVEVRRMAPLSIVLRSATPNGARAFQRDLVEVLGLLSEA